MRILYVITKSNWGGAQRHVFDLAQSMKDRGHEVWVALGGQGLLKKKLEDAGIYTFSIDSMQRDISPGKDVGSFREIFSVIRNKRPDVLHLHSPKAAGLGALAGRLLRVRRIIATVHGWSFNEVRPMHEKIGILFLSWLTMILCHTTVVLSEREYSQGSHFPWVKNKLKLIPPGIRVPTFMSVDGSKQALAKLVGLSPAEYAKKIPIGTIAELHPNKGLPYLIEAMVEVARTSTNTLLIIMGSGQDEKLLREKIESLNLKGSVFLTGYVEDAYEYLKGLSLFILPSLKEGVPYALLEAGQASLPVIATTVGGIPELVEDMKSGILVQPKNSRELSHAISFVIEHPEERRRYGAALKERVSSKYSLDRMVWLVQGLYGDPSIAAQ